MTICEDCKKEMTDKTTVTCDKKTIQFPDGKELDRVPHILTYKGKDIFTCDDCGISRGGIHHFGCDMEVCPKCDGQLISCGCLDTNQDLLESFKEALSGTRTDEEINNLVMRMTAQDLEKFFKFAQLKDYAAGADLLNEVRSRPD